MDILNDHDNSCKIFSNIESSSSCPSADGVLVTQVSSGIGEVHPRDTELQSMAGASVTDVG